MQLDYTMCPLLCYMTLPLQFSILAGSLLVPTLQPILLQAPIQTISPSIKGPKRLSQIARIHLQSFDHGRTEAWPEKRRASLKREPRSGIPEVLAAGSSHYLSLLRRISDRHRHEHYQCGNPQDNIRVSLASRCSMVWHGLSHHSHCFPTSIWLNVQILQHRCCISLLDLDI